jgi:hypothetical protein
MAWHLRRLLEAVKEAACGLEGRWGWLAGPIALLARMWTRRERREAAAAMQAVQGMLQAFLGLIEDFRAGRLAPQDAMPEANEAASGEIAAPPPLSSAAGVGEGTCGAGGAEAYPSPSRIGPHFCEQKWEPVAGPSLSLKGRAIVGADGVVALPISPAAQWIPACAGMTGTVKARTGLPERIAARARPPPKDLFRKIEVRTPGTGVLILLRYRNDNRSAVTGACCRLPSLPALNRRPSHEPPPLAAVHTRDSRAESTAR